MRQVLVNGRTFLMRYVGNGKYDPSIALSVRHESTVEPSVHNVSSRAGATGWSCFPCAMEIVEAGATQRPRLPP